MLVLGRLCSRNTEWQRCVSPGCPGCPAASCPAQMPALSPVRPLCLCLLLRLAPPPTACPQHAGSFSQLPPRVLKGRLPFAARRSAAVAEGSLEALVQLGERASDEQRTHCWRTVAVLVQHTDSHEAVRSSGEVLQLAACCWGWAGFG